MKLMGVGTMGMLVGTEAHSGEAAAGQMGMSGEGLGCEVNVLRWEDIPADERSYVSAG